MSMIKAISFVHVYTSYELSAITRQYVHFYIYSICVAIDLLFSYAFPFCKLKKSVLSLDINC